MTVKTFPYPDPMDSAGPSSAKGISGLLGTLGSAIPLVGPLLGGIFSRNSAKRQNQQQMAMAREQMAFQERMSSTAYQRAAKDLEKAGLNRILALGSPASSPGGAQAQIVNEGQPAINTALAMRRQVAEIKNIEATTAKTNAEIQNVGYEGNILHASWGKVQEEINNLRSTGELLKVQKQVQDAIRTIRGYEGIIIKSEADLWKALQNMGEDAGILGKILGGSAATLVKLAIHAIGKR